MKMNEFFLAEPFAYYIIKNLGNTYENCATIKLLRWKKNVAEMSYHYHHLRFAEMIW